MITQCPNCNLYHEYDNDQDTYPTAAEIVFSRHKGEKRDRFTAGFLCECGAVLALFVTDQFGGTLYVPCTESP